MGQMLTPVHVRSVRIEAEEDEHGARASIQAADVSNANVKGTTANGVLVNEGTYLHRSDVIALLEGYAAQIDEAPTGERFASPALRNMAEHIRGRGV